MQNLFSNILPIARAQVSTELVRGVNTFYEWSIMIAGILAFGLIVVGGIQYIVSAGNPGSQSDAKDRIIQAVTGLVLLLSGGFILSTVNPRLTNIPTISSSPQQEPQKILNPLDANQEEREAFYREKIKNNETYRASLRFTIKDKIMKLAPSEKTAVLNAYQTLVEDAISDTQIKSFLMRSPLNFREDEVVYFMGLSSKERFELLQGK